MQDGFVRVDMLERFLKQPTFGPEYKPRRKGLPSRAGKRRQHVKRVWAQRRVECKPRVPMRPFSPSDQARSIAEGFRRERFGPRILLASALLSEQRLDGRLDARAWILVRQLVRAANGAAVWLSRGYDSIRTLSRVRRLDLEDVHPRLLERAAQLRHPQALYFLGAWMDMGEFGYAREPAQAFECFKLAAAQGHAHSEWLCGVTYFFGTDYVAKNETLGIELLHSAATKKFEGALQMLARFYAIGSNGFPKDSVKAEFYRRQLDGPDVVGYT